MRRIVGQSAHLNDALWVLHHDLEATLAFVRISSGSLVIFADEFDRVRLPVGIVIIRGAEESQLE